EIRANDRSRVIRFRQEPAGSQQTGSGNLSPTQITVRGGVNSSSEITFEARMEGALMIKAITEELVPAQSLLVIVRRSPSRLSRLFNSSVYAETNTFEILPPTQDVVIRGATQSIAVFWINLSRHLEVGEIVSIELKTNPSDSEIMYRGQKLRGFMNVTLEKKKTAYEIIIKSDEIHVLSSQPRTVRVVAKIIPRPNTIGSQARAEASVNFVPAHPEKIILSADQEKIPIDRIQAWLSLKLGDRDKVALQAFEGKHYIRLSSNNPDLVMFDQESIMLSYPQRPTAQPKLSWKGLPNNSQIHVTAEDQEGDLEHGEATITLESLIRKVVLNGLNGVIYGWREDPLTICLGGEGEKHHLPADCNRQIIVKASSGWLSERMHMIERDQQEMRAIYRAPILGGNVTVTVESPGLEEWKLEMRVRTAASVLVLLAGLGGMVGGIIRHIYKEGVQRIRP